MASRRHALASSSTARLAASVQPTITLDDWESRTPLLEDQLASISLVRDACDQRPLPDKVCRPAEPGRQLDQLTDPLLVFWYDLVSLLARSLEGQRLALLLFLRLPDRRPRRSSQEAAASEPLKPPSSTTSSRLPLVRSRARQRPRAILLLVRTA